MSFCVILIHVQSVPRAQDWTREMCSTDSTTAVVWPLSLVSGDGEMETQRGREGWRDGERGRDGGKERG